MASRAATSRKIVLISSPSREVSALGTAKSLVRATEPLGVLSLAAALEAAGHEVGVIDGYAEGLSVDQVVSRAAQAGPDFVGLSCLTAEATTGVELLGKLRKALPQTRIILGNIHASIFAQYYLERGLADVVVHGEGDFSLPRVIEALAQDGDLNSIPGLTYRAGGDIVETGPAELITDLDNLPLPARHLLDMSRYRLSFYFLPSALFRRLEPARALITSRGCPIGCTFCAVHCGRRPRYRSLDRLMEEWDVLVNDYGARTIFFLDSLFIANSARLTEFCERLISRKSKVMWYCEGHVAYITPEKLKLMRRAGCRILAYGIESGVQQLLNNVGKKSSLEQIEQAVRWTKEAGIDPVGLFMLGLPGENWDLSLKTIDFARKLPIKYAQFSITTPYPGTELFRQAAAGGEIDPLDWDRFSAYASFSDNLPIWSPAEMSRQELVALQRLALRRFFLRPGPIWHLIKKMRPGSLAEIWQGGWSGLHNALSRSRRPKNDWAGAAASPVPERLSPQQS